MSLSLQFVSTVFDADKNVITLFNEFEKSLIQRGHNIVSASEANLFKVNDILHTILYPSNEESAYFIHLENIDLAITYEGCFAKSKSLTVSLEYLLDHVFFGLHLVLTGHTDFTGIEVRRNIELNLEEYEYVDFDFSNIALDKTLFIPEFMETFKEEQVLLAVINRAFDYKYFSDPYEIRSLINDISALPDFSKKLREMVSLFDTVIFNPNNDSRNKGAQIDLSGNNYHLTVTIIDGLLWIASEAEDNDMTPMRCTTEEFVVNILYFVQELEDELSSFDPRTIIRTFK